MFSIAITINVKAVKQSTLAPKTYKLTISSPSPKAEAMILAICKPYALNVIERKAQKSICGFGDYLVIRQGAIADDLRRISLWH